MNEASQTSAPTISGGSPKCIVLRELEFGPPRFAVLGGQTVGEFGQSLAPANLSATQAKALGLLTSGICGPTRSTSPSSAALTSLLESKLRQRTASLGSTLYALTWKTRITPSQQSIGALRASARRISDSGFTGAPWVTPTTRDWKDGANPDVNVPENALLGRLAWQAGWPSPTTPSGGQTWPEGTTTTGETPDGRKLQVTLGLVADAAGWPTPRAEDAESSGARLSRGVNDTLTAVARISGPARLTADGALLTGSVAGMDAGGQLNPAHSRWLMLCRDPWEQWAPGYQDWLLWQALTSAVSPPQSVFGPGPCEALGTPS